MQEQNKNVLVFLGVLAFIFLIQTGLLFILPLLFIGGIYFLIIKNKKSPKIINGNYTNPMNSFSISDFLTKVKNTGTVVFVVIIALILLANMVVIIPAGQTGVYHLFGKVRDAEVPSGIHLINPLATIVPMSIRTEQYTMSIATNEGQKLGDDSIESLTKEGLKVNLDMTVLYRVIEDEASEVYKTIGTNYEDKIIRTQVRTAIRDVIAIYEAKDIYSDKRGEVVAKIKERLEALMKNRGIEIESVLLRNIFLPSLLTGAIESKLAAEQEAQRYEFILQKETKEAERKRIEATGQRDAQTIITASLTDRYLQYLYIQNLENRAGTIYVPYDLPLLKGL